MKIHLLLGAVLVASAALAFAGPGAHGPNGEHLAAAGGAAAMSTAPTFEAHTELFEVVGQLSGDELSIFIDRYDTNEPLLSADSVEVEFGAIKAAGKFHADQGDYVFTDNSLLKALAEPGKHALVFTVIAGKDSDLIEATLAVTAPVAEPAAHLHRGWIAGGAVLVLLIAAAAWQRRRSLPFPRTGA